MAYAATLSPRPAGGQLNGFRYSANTQAVPAGMKKCGHCQEIKDAVEFSADASRGDGLRGWCKACEAEARSKRYKKRKAGSDSGPVKRRASETGYRGHDASQSFSAQDDVFQRDSIGMTDAERVRQELLQAWTEEAQLHAAAARAPALAEQLALMRRAAALGPTHSFPVSALDLDTAPLLAHLSPAQIAQHAAAHVAQQQRSSAFSPVQQADKPAGIQAAASLAQAMDMIRQHAMVNALMGKAAAVDPSAERQSPHTSDSEMSAVESLTGMKRGRLGHTAAGVKPADRPRRGIAASSAIDLHALNTSGTTTGSLKTNSSGCALTAALEGAAAARLRLPSQPQAAEEPRRIDLMRAPGSAESTEGPAPAAPPPLSTAQQQALVNRILVSMGHPPLSSANLAAIMGNTGTAAKCESREQSPVEANRALCASPRAADSLDRRSVPDARASVSSGYDLEQASVQQAQDISAALAAMVSVKSVAASMRATDAAPRAMPSKDLRAVCGSPGFRGIETVQPVPGANTNVDAMECKLAVPVPAPLPAESPADDPRRRPQEGDEDPTKWLSRVSLLLLALRAAGFAQAAG